VSFENNRPATFYRCNFNFSSADIAGSCVRHTVNFDLTLEKCTFYSCYVQKAIKTCTCSPCSPSCTCFEGGGCFFMSTSSQLVKIISCVFQNISLTGGCSYSDLNFSSGGVIWFQYSTLLINGSTFIGCVSNVKGGVIGMSTMLQYNKYEYNITDCVFEGCQAGKGGGAIYSMGGTLKVESCTFRGCVTTETGGVGGAIYLSNGLEAILELTDCKFYGCESVSDGGAVNSTFATLQVLRSFFYYCFSNGIGGAIRCHINKNSVYFIIYFVKLLFCFLSLLLILHLLEIL
jgi:predicted outer membrane repeat protein